MVLKALIMSVVTATWSGLATTTEPQQSVTDELCCPSHTNTQLCRVWSDEAFLPHRSAILASSRLLLNRVATRLPKPGATQPGADKLPATKPSATELQPWPVRQPTEPGLAASAAAIGVHIYPEVEKGLRHLTSAAGVNRLVGNAFSQARR